MSSLEPLCVCVQSFEPKRNTKNPRNSHSALYTFAGTQQRNRCSTFRVRRNQTIYWKEGLLVTFQGGYLRSVHSKRGNWVHTHVGAIPQADMMACVGFFFFQCGVVRYQLEEEEERRHQDHLSVRHEGFLRHGVHHRPRSQPDRAVVPRSVHGSVDLGDYPPVF